MRTEFIIGLDIPQVNSLIATSSKSLQTLVLSYKDADEFYVNVGSITINGVVYVANSQITKAVTGLAASTWYAIYVSVPTSGIVLSSADIQYSTTMPTEDVAKHGWYHGTNTTWRCIGFILSTGASAIFPFSIEGRLWKTIDAIIAHDLSSVTPSNTFTTYTLTLPIGNVRAYGRLFAAYSNVSSSVMAKPKGAAGGGVEIGYVHATNYKLHFGFVMLDTNADKQVEVKWFDATTNTISFSTSGFYLPINILN